MEDLEKMEKIYEILQSIRPEFNFHESTNFVEEGYLDSFDVVSLISELEDAFNILIDALDILPENFSSVQSIAEIIKKNGGAVS